MEGAPWAIMLGVSFIKVLGVSDGILAVSDSTRMDNLVRSRTGRSTAEQIGLNMQYIYQATQPLFLLGGMPAICHFTESS